MSILVVDASVVVKWFLPEDGSDEAVSLLEPRNELIAPDLVWVEVSQVAWKLVRRGLLERRDAEHMVRDMARFPVELTASSRLIPTAVALALDHDRSVYDCVYLALAVERRATMITADSRLVNALSRTPMVSRIRLLGAGKSA